MPEVIFKGIVNATANLCVIYIPEDYGFFVSVDLGPFSFSRYLTPEEIIELFKN